MALHDLKKQAAKILDTEGETVSPEIKRQRKANKRIEQIKREGKSPVNLSEFGEIYNELTAEQLHDWSDDKPGEKAEKEYDDEGNLIKGGAIMGRIISITPTPMRVKTPKEIIKAATYKLGTEKGKKQKIGGFIETEEPRKKLPYKFRRLGRK